MMGGSCREEGRGGHFQGASAGLCCSRREGSGGQLQETAGAKHLHLHLHLLLGGLEGVGSGPEDLGDAGVDESLGMPG